MKFIFAILILLPALALAFDDIEKELEKRLYDQLDANNDEKVSLQEAETYFMSYDTGNDGSVTEAEFIAALDEIDPHFKGKEAALFSFLDQDANGIFNIPDVQAVYELTDSNNDSRIRRAELHAVFVAVLSTVRFLPA